jgi:hypothetical protein
MALAHSKVTAAGAAAPLERARASISSEKSEATTAPEGATRAASSSARSPVPVATSRTRSPGPTPASSTARRRQAWCSPAVMTEFMTS